SSVDAIDPVGMTKASTTKARKIKARMKATRMDSRVSLTLLASVSPALPRRAGAGGLIAGVGGVGGAVAGCVMQPIVREGSAPVKEGTKEWSARPRPEVVDQPDVVVEEAAVAAVAVGGAKPSQLPAPTQFSTCAASGSTSATVI